MGTLGSVFEAGHGYVCPLLQWLPRITCDFVTANYIPAETLNYRW